VSWAEIINWLIVPLAAAAIVGLGGLWLARHTGGWVCSQ
jgi:hypothetical protein